jgi:transcriptional regulator with XRE-family HTH domain
MHSQPTLAQDMQQCITPVNAGMQNDLARPSAYFGGMSEPWPITYVKHLMVDRHVTASALAKLAGLSNTTLTRPLNDPDYKHEISIPTLEKLQHITGVPYAPFSNPRSQKPKPAATPGFADEAIPFLMGTSAESDPIRARKAI